MKSKNPMILAGILFLFFFCTQSSAQTFGTNASAVWLSDCNQSNFFNTSGSNADLIGPVGNVFNNANLGVHTQNSGTLMLRGAALKTFKNPATANVCSVRMYYRIYQQSATPGAFNNMDISFLSDCDIPSGQFPTGGTCIAGDQYWQRVVPDGSTVPYAPINLTSFAAGNYVLEVYYDVAGSFTTTTGCTDTILLNNGGANYKANFSIQNPTIASNNPTSCNGSEGFVTINGLVPGAVYAVTYTDDGTPVGPVNITANASGQVIIAGLNAGVYSNFSLTINGCTTNLFTGVVLSNPIFIPTFTSIPPFCAGSTAPTLPTTSNNGVSGTWSPAVVSNTASGVYTFTPNVGQCGLPVSINITVTPKTTPTFSFGTTRTICAGGLVPILPNASTNGITGTWSPAVVNNTASGVYTFTPTTGLCANPTTFTLTVNPNITPTFSFGTALTICASGTVPTLPNASSNGINGTWSPATIDNQNSGTYTYTPTAGQCATTTSLTVTVNPNVVPTFSFGSSLTICAGGVVPTLPTSSTNGINGTWSPATISNTASGMYTFTPAAGPCATPTTFTVTVTPNIVPTFSFGTSLTICANGTVPSLPGTSTNGINGTWSPAVVDNQNSGVYTFTPTAGPCATPTTFTLTVTPNIVPTFSFGTSLTICANGTVPSLPGTSSNGINGTWSPATVSNTTSGVYTFTPSAGPCALPTTFTVTVNPNVVPTFSFGSSLTICANASVPSLPGTSTNGITGTWSPATVSNTTSGVYTFTPSAGLCATPATFTVTVTPNIVPNFSFGTSLTICASGTVPSLPGTSNNGITGTWSPAVVDNQASGTYTFTPTTGLCAVPTTFTVTVNPNIPPTFSFGSSLTLCANGTVPTLPNASTNGINGTWSPATVSNTTSGTYTFTPTVGQCATPATFTVTVTPNVVPTFSFGSSLTICANASVPTLPGTSTNGITGTWSPATVSNTASGTYTFTPTTGLCATPTTFTVTVTPNVVPTFSFGTSLVICANGTVPTLPGTSTNGINGTWSPAIVDNQNSGTYTFTPAAGPCAVPTTFTVTVNPNITPTFSFGTSLVICANGTVPTLPNASANGINGTWSPATVSNTASGTYTFTPTAGQCATTTTYTVTVTTNIVPAFSFGTSLVICANGTVPTLPNASTNGINGTWSPATVSNTASGIYTFTPAGAQCATPTTFTVTVNQNIPPTFSFGTSLSICNNATVPTLPGISSNGITGTWSPAVIDNQNSGTYTFTPTTGLCAVPTTLTVTVNPILTPAFSFGTVLNICANAVVPTLTTTSSNGITGTWSPATVNNQNSAVYTFTPAAGQCATPTTFTVNVTANTVPTFSFGNALTICSGGIVPVLPASSDNAVPGTWSPATVSNTASGIYTFTPATGICATVVTYTVTVNPILTPTFSFGTSSSICIGATVPTLVASSTNGISGTWSPSTINNQASGTYTFTPNAGQCANTTSFTVQVNPIPSVTVRTDTTINDGSIMPPTNFSTTPANVTLSWTNSNSAIGLPAFGTGNVPSFVAINQGSTNITATITVTPSINGCIGTARTYVITVRPLNKDVFVPNVFSPNGDGKNDQLLVFGNYIDKIEMRIFNQWGQQVALINSRTQGWDGRHKGQPQPVGVYMYALRAVLSNGKVVEMKGSITLIR